MKSEENMTIYILHGLYVSYELFKHKMLYLHKKHAAISHSIRFFKEVWL